MAELRNMLLKFVFFVNVQFMGKLFIALSLLLGLPGLLSAQKIKVSQQQFLKLACHAWQVRYITDEGETDTLDTGSEDAVIYTFNKDNTVLMRAPDDADAGKYSWTYSPANSHVIIKGEDEDSVYELLDLNAKQMKLYQVSGDYEGSTLILVPL